MPIVPGVLCAHGHANPEDQRFCSACGIPIAVPVDAQSSSAPGRWNVDPTSRHEYRYWDGDSWTEHVADNGNFSSDSPPDSQPTPGQGGQDKWMLRVAAVAMTLVSALLVTAAFSTLLSIRRSDTPPTPATMTEPVLTPVLAAPPQESSIPSAPPAAPTDLMAKIGAHCLPNSNTGMTVSGAVAYCAQVQGGDAYVWSLTPGEIPYPLTPDGSPAPPRDIGLIVCTTQTEQSEDDCISYLQQPSDPGDGLGPS